MVLFEQEYLNDLLNAQDGPCLSLYQPTHRRHPENQQDPIRYRNLVKKLEQSLKQTFDTDKVAELLEPFMVLEQDLDFWKQTLDGIAVLRSPSLFRIYGLQRPVPELAVVADSFHTKPLQRYVQTTDRFQVLGLTLHEVFLYEGNRDAVDQLPLPEGVPATIKEALGSDLTDEHITVATYGGRTAKGVNMVHGHGGKKDEVDIDAERFFRTIDRAIHEHVSKPSQLPLILAALPEHHSLFHEISHNPFLIKESIRINPESQSEDSIRQMAWELMEPTYKKRLNDLKEEYHQANANKLGSGELKDIARAAAEGRVRKLMIESGKVVPGKIDDTGKISRAKIENPEVDDVLDDLGAMVLQRGGEVVVVPPEDMPTRDGATAIFRY